ncbi:MAG: efflux RND transporter periplasmic adaptor subunit [Phycisphaerae bacterium]
MRLHRAVGLFLSSWCAALAFAQFGPQEVLVCPVTQEDLPPAMRLVGNVLPQRSAIVAAEVGGIVSELTVEEGASVRTGDVLCKLDATEIRLRVEEANAELGTREAMLAELEAGTRKEEIVRLQAAVDESQAMFDKWQFEQRRVADLAAREQSNPKEQNDTAMELLAAQRRLGQEKARLETALNGPRKEEIARARFAALAQQAAVRRLERELNKTEIRAPFDGVVTAKRTEIGEWINPGGAVWELVALDTVKVRVDVPEAIIRFARVGAMCSLEFEAIAATRGGEIRRVIPRGTEAARTFPVEIDLPNADHSVLPGMLAQAYVPAGEPGKRTMASKDAIVARGISKQVFVIRPGEKDSKMAIPVPVETGLERNGLIEIQSPQIQPGDLVVCRANERLFGPMPVIPKPLDPGPTSQPAGPASASD